MEFYVRSWPGDHVEYTIPLAHFNVYLRLLLPFLVWIRKEGQTI